MTMENRLSGGAPEGAPRFNAAVVADRLRAAAEFRRSGMLFDALMLVTWARANRLIGRDTGLVPFPDRDRVDALAASLFRRGWGWDAMAIAASLRAEHLAEARV